MFRLILSALRARRVQTLAIFALTLLAVSGGSAAPWFLSWAQDTVAQSDIAKAPLDQRVTTLKGTMRPAADGTSPAETIRQKGQSTLDFPGAEVTVGAKIYGNLVVGEISPQANASSAYLAFRSDVCAHLRLTGSCPGDGEVVIQKGTATLMHIGVGDQINFDSFRLGKPASLRISGTFEVADVLGPYWAGSGLLQPSTGAPSADIAPIAFISEATLAKLPVDSLDVDYHVFLPPEAFADGGGALLRALDTATNAVRDEGLEVTRSPASLVSEIRTDRDLAAGGVWVAAVEMVLLSWFALYLAVRQTSGARRGEIGLLKLRGAARWRIWMLTAQQSALPMLVGAVVGIALGYLGAAAVAADTGPLRPRGDWVATLVLSVAVAVGIALGALVAAIVAELRVVQSSVTDLMRRVPTRRTGWRASLVDLAVVVVAIAGVYQGYAELGGGGGVSTLSLLAPGLIGLAAALLAGRALPWLAAKSGAAAIRSGRPGAALSALSVARRPGTDRLFAVLAVCVAVSGTVLFSWYSASQAWSRRAALDLGAPRVLVVHATDSAALLDAVRAVDPSGDYAMAVALSPEPGSGHSLAVDSTRLAKVAILDDSYGIADRDTVAARLRPPVPAAPPVRDGALTVSADLPPGGPVVDLHVWLAPEQGAWRDVRIPITEAVQNYVTPITGCGSVGCRLVGFEPVSQQPGATVVLHRVSQRGADVVTPAMFADVTRWRGDVAPDVVGPILTANADGLAITSYGGELPQGVRSDTRVLANDGPMPLPVLKGPAPLYGGRSGDSRLEALGVEAVPYRVVGSATLLPRLGDNGVLMDLGSAKRASGQQDESASLEVWLTANAPNDVTARLADHGVTVLTDTTVGDVRRDLAHRGSGLSLQFGLFAAVVLLLVAAGALAVATSVERRDRAEELRHLRDQGLPDRGVRFAGYAATMLVVTGSIVTGLLAAMIGHEVVSVSLPVFADDWNLIPTYRGLGSWGLVLAVSAAVVVLVPAAAAASWRVVASVRTRGEAQ
jgi:hypothetical protein